MVVKQVSLTSLRETSQNMLTWRSDCALVLKPTDSQVYISEERETGGSLRSSKEYQRA